MKGFLGLKTQCIAKSSGIIHFSGHFNIINCLDLQFWHKWRSSCNKKTGQKMDHGHQLKIKLWDRLKALPSNPSWNTTVDLNVKCVGEEENVYGSLSEDKYKVHFILGCPSSLRKDIRKMTYVDTMYTKALFAKFRQIQLVAEWFIGKYE